MVSRAKAEQSLTALARDGSEAGREQLVEALRRVGEAAGALEGQGAQARVADLVATVLAHASPQQRDALAAQLAAAPWLPPELAGRMTEEAVERRDAPALLAGLAANPGLSHALLARLAEIAETTPWVRAPLARHPRLTPRLAAEVHRAAGRDLRRELEARFPELAGEAPAAAGDSGEALVAKLHAAGELGPGRLLNFVREGRLDLFERGLGALTGRPAAAIEAVVADPASPAFAALCAAAGFDRAVAPQVRDRVAALVAPRAVDDVCGPTNGAQGLTGVAQRTLERLHFAASDRPEAQEARVRLAERYGDCAVTEAQAIVALGGDGFMLEVLHATLQSARPIYGMNRGSVGFLMNDYVEDRLIERIAVAERAVIHPLSMNAIDRRRNALQGLAINEVSLLRQTRQTAKLRVSIDGTLRMPELVCDGALVCTPAGSTAYNLSAHGPIIPLKAQVLALTPISAFRPRRWRGALLPHTARVTFEVLEADKRPVSAVADNFEVRDVCEVHIAENRDISLTMLFDAGRSLEERVLAEQFSG